MRKRIHTEKGATPRGPYSQAIVADGPVVYVSAQGPVDPQTGEMRLGSFPEQAELVFQNVATILAAAGASWEHAVKVTVYLADFDDFAAMNEVYSRYVSEPFPARSTVEARVGAAAIAIDCIALMPQAE